MRALVAAALRLNHSTTFHIEFRIDWRTGYRLLRSTNTLAACYFGHARRG